MQKIKMKGKEYEYPYSTILCFDDDHIRIKVMAASQKKTIPQIINQLLNKNEKV